jgi:RimJ/RimL family protein N-acetyltransferase
MLGTLALTPAVVRYIGDGSPWTDARVQDVSAHNVEHWRRHGFGWRVATLTDHPASGPVGFIMLGFAGDGAGIAADDYEIGWWLNPSVWGRGLAREGAAALRDEAFERVGAPSIAARIQPANRASLSVAAAIGLTPDGESVGRGGEPIAVLRLSAADWAAGR